MDGHRPLGSDFDGGRAPAPTQDLNSETVSLNADAGASTVILWAAAVCAGGGGRVRSLRRGAGAAGNAAP